MGNHSGVSWLLFLLPPADMCSHRWDHSTQPHPCVFYLGSEDQTRALALVQQALPSGISPALCGLFRKALFMSPLRSFQQADLLTHTCSATQVLPEMTPRGKRKALKRKNELLVLVTGAVRKHHERISRRPRMPEFM